MASSAREAGEVKTVKYPGPEARAPRVGHPGRRPAVVSAPHSHRGPLTVTEGRAPGCALEAVPLRLGGARTSKQAWCDECPIPPPHLPRHGSTED